MMETGYDILFFWVARMAMLANHFSDHKIPFETIYLHGMVYCIIMTLFDRILTPMM